jgi:hypothetical protein
MALCEMTDANPSGHFTDWSYPILIVLSLACTQFEIYLDWLLFTDQLVGIVAFYAVLYFLIPLVGF